MDWPMTDVQSLCVALATRRGLPGRLTMTRCRMRDASGCRTKWDMVVWWQDGGFYVEDEGDTDESQRILIDGTRMLG